MLDQNFDDKIINLRRMSAEYYQKAAWNQLLSLDNYREKNFDGHLSLSDQLLNDLHWAVKRL